LGRFKVEKNAASDIYCDDNFFLPRMNMDNYYFHNSDDTSLETESNDDMMEEESCDDEKKFNDSGNIEDSMDIDEYSNNEVCSNNALESFCMNCHRTPLHENETHLLPQTRDKELQKSYCLMLKEVDIRDSSFRRKYSNMHASEVTKMDNDVDFRKVKLCGLCRIYLAADTEEHKHNTKRKVLEQLVWPAMIWRLLKMKEIIKLWDFLPELWRAWWKPQVCVVHPNIKRVLNMISLKVGDATEARYLLQKITNDLKMKEMIDVVDNWMLPNVKCPWGCDEYPDEVGGLSLDIIFKRFIPSLNIDSIAYSHAADFTLVTGVREDYIAANWARIAHNPAWPVKPSIVFIDGCPKFATCRFHLKGDRRQYIHPLIAPYGPLTSLNSEILAPVQLQCRTLKPFKAHQYSNSFAMHSMRGCAYGLDTAMIRCNGNIQELPDFIQKNQNFEILSSRSDCYSYISEISNGSTKSNMHRNVADEILDDFFSMGHNESKCRTLKQSYGTYISLYDSIKLQERLKADLSPASIVIDDRKKKKKEILYCSPWPKTRVQVHPNNEFGARFPPMFLFPSAVVEGFDLRVFWFLGAMLISQLSLWESTCAQVKVVKSWEGWFLLLLSQNCLGIHKPSKLFSWKTKNNTEKFLYMMELLGYLKLNADGDNLIEEEDEICEDSDDNSTVHDNSNYVADEQSDTGMSSTTFTDGKFYPEHLAYLLDPQQDVLCIDKQNEAEEYIIETHHSLVLYYNSNTLENESNIPMTIHDINGTSLELVFLGVSQSTESNKLEAWTGSCYTRHGGKEFPRWWKLDSNESNFCQTFYSNQLPRLKWNYALYKRHSNSNQKELRHRFLSTIGGQNKAYCSVHDRPLIIQPKHVKKLCSKQINANDAIEKIYCNRKAKFSCPTDQCNAALCSQHHQELKPVDHYLNHHCIKPTVEPIMTQSRMESMDDDIDECDEISINSLNPSKEIFNFLPPMAVPYNAFAEQCTGYEAQGLEEKEEDLMATIPTTHAGIESLEIDEVSGTLLDNTCQYLPLHIILNCSGGALARSQFKIYGTSYHQHLLQGIVSKSFGHTVPLLYPEGTLFPSIFYQDDASDGALIGALPSALLSSNSFVQSHGIAPIESHIRSRVMNSSLGTHYNTKYLAYLFDLQTNIRARSYDNRTVLHRGFQATEALTGIKTPLFDTEQIDSHPTVNKLRAAMGEDYCSYFVTFTCNQRDHFGLKKITSWLTGDEIIEEFQKDIISYDDKLRLRETLQENSAVLITRQWTKVATLFMTYIAKSSEEPLGKIKDILWRFEHQEPVGNPPHIHGVVTREPLPEGRERQKELKKILERIRGSSYDLIRFEETEGLIKEGLINNWSEAEEIREHGRRVLRHCCSARCQRRYGPGDGETRCRVPNHALINPNPNEHALIPINVHHSQAALKIMEILGLYKYDVAAEQYFPIESSDDKEMQNLMNSLKSWKHSPPAHAGESPFSPVNPRLFIATKSSQNISHPSGYFLARYVLEYISKIDENNSVMVSAIPYKANGISINAEFLHNTKITSSAIHENKRKAQRRDRLHPQGRAIAMSETIMQMLGIPQVYTTYKFIYIQTCALELRTGTVQKASISAQDLKRKPKRPEDLTFSSVPMAKIRNEIMPKKFNTHWPRWRTMSDTEVLSLKANAFSQVSLDKPTMFSGRPSELRFVRRIRLYFRWFYINSMPIEKQKQKMLEKVSKLLDIQLHKSSWVDAFGHQVFVRRAALSEIIEYLESNTKKSMIDFYALDHPNRLTRATSRSAHTAYDKNIELFHRLHVLTKQSNEETNDLVVRFIGKADESNNAKLPIIWYSPPKAMQSSQFLIHLLLTLGQFDCELNLYSQGSIKKAFMKAKLLTDGITDTVEEKNQHEMDIRKILNLWFMSEHRTFPGGTISFDRNLVAAYNTLRRGLLDESLPCNELPPCIYTRIQEETSKDCALHIAGKNEILIRTTRNSIAKKILF
jgi:hypothetical protein